MPSQKFSFAQAVEAALGGRRFQNQKRPRKTKTLKPPKPTKAERQRWKLVLVDQEPIRHAATEAYQKAGRQLEELHKTAEHFSMVDRPAYDGWLAANLGALLTELRQTALQVDEKGSLLDAVRMMSFLGRLSPYEAYQKVLKQREAWQKQPPGDAQTADGENEADDGNNPFFAEDSDDDDEDIEDLFDAIFGAKKPAGKGAKRQQRPADPTNDDEPTDRRREAEPAPQERSISQRVKTAYRAIVRCLHPDHNANLTPYDKQLWHDAQTAYQNEDLERLETILAVSELARGGELPTGSGIAGLMALTRQLGESIRQAQKQLREMKRSPAWRFTSLKSKDALTRKVETGLRRELVEGKAELAAIEKELAFCQTPPPPRKPKPKKAPTARKEKGQTPARNAKKK